MTDPIEGSAPVADVPSELSDTRPPNDRLPAVVPPIAGFWRRIAAFALDGVLLGVAAQALVWTMSPFWFRIGPYGRFVGALIALLYFGLMNSHVRDGQTVGKRMMGIAVRDRGNQAVGIGRSMARTLIWLIPWMLNGWGFLPPNATFLMVRERDDLWRRGAVVFTMVFNTADASGPARMACDTFVIMLTAPSALRRFRRWRGFMDRQRHLLAVSILCPRSPPCFRDTQRHSRLGSPARVLESDPRFFSASVFDQRTRSNGQSTRALQIDPGTKATLRRMSAIRPETTSPGVRWRRSQISRNTTRCDHVSSAYDLGIATGRVTQIDHHTSQSGERLWPLHLRSIPLSERQRRPGLDGPPFRNT